MKKAIHIEEPKNSSLGIACSRIVIIFIDSKF